MTEPNTSTNSTSCMSGWSVEKTIRPVLRIVLRRLRPATSPMSRVTRVRGSAARSRAVETSSGAAIVATSGPDPTAALAGFRTFDARLLRDMAGEAEEHVVERRPPEPHVGDWDQ